jgi:hypothetical protein
MGIVGCFDLHIFCDGPDHSYEFNGFAQFVGDSIADTLRDARKSGWWVDRTLRPDDYIRGTGKALCPKHNTPAERRAAREKSQQPVTTSDTGHA